MVNANKKNLIQRTKVTIIPEYKHDLNLKHDPQIHYLLYLISFNSLLGSNFRL